MASCFCRSCGAELEETDKFCTKCGENMKITEIKTPGKVLSLETFTRSKGKERACWFNKKTSSPVISPALPPSKKRSVTIQVGIMARDSFGELKITRGKKLPVKVLEDSDAVSIKKESIAKHAMHDQNFCALEDFMLLYPDGKQVFKLPCLPHAQAEDFRLDKYKAELAKPYSQIVLYLCTFNNFHSMFSSKIDYFGESSSLFSGVDNVEPKHLFNHEDTATDIFSNTNELPDYLFMDNANGNSDLCNQEIFNEHVPVNDTVADKLDSKKDKVLSYQENIKLMQDAFVCDFDVYHLLTVRRRHVWKDTKQKLPRLLMQKIQPIRIAFTGEEAVDAGGPNREYFSLVFDDIEKVLMNGPENCLTFIHDFKKLEDMEFELFGKIVALSLLQDCPGPRNFHKALSSCILNGPEIDVTVTDVSDYDIQCKLIEIKECTEENFDKLLSAFPERFYAGVTQYKVSFSEREKFVSNVSKHFCVFQCLAEIQQFKQGLELSGILQLLQNHYDDGMKEFSYSGSLCAQDVLNVFVTVVYSSEKEKKEKEEDIYYYFTNYLDSLQADEGGMKEIISLQEEKTEIIVSKKLSLQSVIRFCTGSKFIIPSMLGTGTIKFCVCSRKQFRYVCNCEYLCTVYYFSCDVQIFRIIRNV